MDAVDHKIVTLLQGNGRLSQEHIAQQVNLSRPAVHERIKRLEEQGVLRGYQARVDWGALGLPLSAFISVRYHTVEVPANETTARIMALRCPDTIITECYRTTGGWCTLLKAHVATPLALQDLIDAIRAIPSVQETLTTMVLSTLEE
ncbi:Lrp/AsnC family transcriptional regulator [Ktedonospora formicarum]|uniref:AsnC family transcriptional regulator n=1 Tax=Ktedonospora formicarum TaxID=2778364 RepID=A0A8J3HYN9_9CHLR|nr:Lrp/AsnC family transcriptional regulator [Ktedonospora formicarum]GHO46169.1 AsnC family transcriptional regulator [Ktedonospora formicarum]